MSPQTSHHGVRQVIFHVIQYSTGLFILPN
ncbi:rCG62908, isoform CRA_b [Rattus norvegicus]|uniref:RCG62908, isoform CRA_b n=1 Tax=Rattus norvegicus TaxID=10116 RepID=A6J2M4_RAT|nr:rCG62908, isoform CRA_b [Rattus norvegicus]